MLKHWPAALILSVHFLIFFGINLLIHPHPDMLDHWVWARFPALSYYEHPPMVAWLIAAITFLFGNSEWTLEIGAQAVNLSILGLAYAICADLFHRRAALFTLLLLATSPYFFFGSVFLHIDQPFLIFWLINLYLLLKFYRDPKPWMFLLIGVVAGLGALSKYITILFYLSMMIHFAIYKPCRKWLLNSYLYLGGLIALAIFSPVIVWNMQNGWVSFLFQFKRGLSGAPLGQNFLLFLFGHLILFGIFWSIWIFYTLYQRRHRFRRGRDPDAILLVLALVPLGFFTLMSLRGSIADPHWANVSYLSLMMIAGKFLHEEWPQPGDTIREMFEDARPLRVSQFLASGLLNLLILMLFLVHIKYPLADLTGYQLRYFQVFQLLGVPESVVDKVVELDNKPMTNEVAFRNQLQQKLTQAEYDDFGEAIVRVARKNMNDPAVDLLGWPESMNQIRTLLQMHDKPDPDYIISKEFQLSSALSFYFPSHPWPHSIQKPERNQWSRPEQVRRGNSIVVCLLADCRRVLKHTRERFDAKPTYLGEFTTLDNGRIIRELQVYWLPAEEPLESF